MIGDSVRKALRAEGYAVDWLKDGRAAESALDEHVHDLMLLDLGLPKKDGIEVLRAIRQKGNAIPVMVLTARDAVADRVAGLDAGADDYLVKPFDLDELSARIRALLRRKGSRQDGAQASTLIRHGNLTIDTATREVTRDGTPVSLSAREFTLLAALLDRPGVVMSVAQLQEKLYGWDDEVGSNTIEVYVHALRKKLGAETIRNVRGVGYMVPKAQ